MPTQTNPDQPDTCQVQCIHQERVGQARNSALAPRETERLADTFKVLGDPNRVRLVMALLEGEMCVCDLAAFLGLSDSAVSHQLRRLKDQALVRARRSGPVLYYSLDDDHVAELLRVALEHVRE
jgi:DNA-binding transcriptional ArsR family regulator